MDAGGFLWLQEIALLLLNNKNVSSQLGGHMHENITCMKALLDCVKDEKSVLQHYRGK